MNAIGLTSAITALANAIACSMTAEEMALWASIFVQLGDTLATLATCKGTCEEAEGDS